MIIRIVLGRERLKVKECNEPSCEALIFPYGVVLFNVFLPYAYSFEL